MPDQGEELFHGRRDARHRQHTLRAERRHLRREPGDRVVRRARVPQFGSVVLYGVVVFLVPMEPGGGNSGATFTLAASLAGLALVSVPGLRTALAVALIAADGIALLVMGDPHGVTMLVGPALGVLVAAVVTRRAPVPAGSGS
ncbi:hypothetical protein Apa02nite_081730 [Actinoplanes palleronii]|uniref:Uncharacterized protein n=1 Tax=Actinoplanes palleronii TaxID=113570 RepID=A0ABQ4BMZ7_9ACTN|nr:hypothetical protein Apa02nite_081730 [Actinoplanes palleronii]